MSLLELDLILFETTKKGSPLQSKNIPQVHEHAPLYVHNRQDKLKTSAASEYAWCGSRAHRGRFPPPFHASRSSLCCGFSDLKSWPECAINALPQCFGSPLRGRVPMSVRLAGSLTAALPGCRTASIPPPYRCLEPPTDSASPSYLTAYFILKY